MKNLNGKVAVVTGGNSGIGYAAANELKANGAKVIITGRSSHSIKDAAKQLGVIGIAADVTDLSAMDMLASKISATVGNIDILLVNAGVFSSSIIGKISEETFDHQMGVNFKGAVFTIEKLLPLINDGASIINLSSISAYTAMPTTSIYAASKAALNAYTRTAAVELAPKKIRVNAINPGPVHTPIFEKAGMHEDRLEHFTQALQDKIPLQRFGEATEIAKLIAFLASDDSAFITGSEYNIDGGLNLHPIL